jgi:hypothetical protein
MGPLRKNQNAWATQKKLGIIENVKDIGVKKKEMLLLALRQGLFYLNHWICQTFANFED